MEKIDNKELLFALAHQVKKLREQKGVSQQQAFDETGIHFGRVEQGKRDISISTLFNICKYFNTTVTEFFSKGFEVFKE